MLSSIILSKMPRIAKPKTAPTVDSLIADAKTLMESEKTAAPAPQTPKSRVRKSVPATGSAPVKAEKQVKAVKPVKTEAPVLAAGEPSPQPSKKKTFKPLTAELREKLTAHSKDEGVTKGHILSMKSHLMLGKTWSEAHDLAVAKEEKKKVAAATQ